MVEPRFPAIGGADDTERDVSEGNAGFPLVPCCYISRQQGLLCCFLCSSDHKASQTICILCHWNMGSFDAKWQKNAVLKIWSVRNVSMWQNGESSYMPFTGVNGISGFFSPNVSNPKLVVYKSGSTRGSPVDSWLIENCSVAE